MAERRSGGDETWFRLREWTKGQKQAERLSAHVLSAEDYRSMQPSHPLGGPDGLKDSVCLKDGLKWVGAFYFPRGQKAFSDIKNKFKGDLKGVKKNDADGIAFVTNQELSLAERKEIEKMLDHVDLFHLERVTHILDRPESYGVRLEFLNIEMSKEEQLAFIAARDRTIKQLQQSVDRLLKDSEQGGEDSHPEEVTPTYLDSPLKGTGLSFGNSYFNRDKKVHTCSFCGFGFIVNEKSSDPLSLHFASPKAVKCPKCGNADKLL